MLIQIVLFDGFDELDAIAPFEVLDMAAKREPSWRVEYVTIDGREQIIAAHGTTLRLTAKRLSTESPPDVLVVPGGGWADRAATGTRAELDRGEIPAMIRDLAERGTVIASVCTGAMLVAGAGLLKGRPAITHQAAIADLRAYGAQITAARVVDDGNLISAGGITSGIDLSLWLIERFLGEPAATWVAERLEYSRQLPVWRSPASLAKF